MTPGLEKSCLDDIAAAHRLRRLSGKWVGPCPKCGGSKGSDRFNIRDDGGFKCYSCDFKGDVITWLREMEGKTCPEAHETIGRSCEKRNCPAWSKCRMGEGRGRSRYRPRSVAPVQQRRHELPGTEINGPRALWLSWATGLVAKAEGRLQADTRTLEWLGDRGIDQGAAARFRLGQLEHQYRIDRKSIGLPPREDGKKKLWVPDGLLIPIFCDGGLHRIRIRRPLASRQRFLPDLKYVWLQGSGTAPMVIRPQDSPRGAVVVEAELDAMAVAAAHSQVLVIALGTVRAGLPAPLRRELSSLPVILVALDADGNRDGKTGAGPLAIATWRQSFRQARFWPVPQGKDPGQYARLGSLHAWVEAGLVPPVKPRQEQILTPDCASSGGDAPTDDVLRVEGKVRILTLKNGRSFSLVEDRATWMELAARGEVVFTALEMERLQQATADMSQEERLAAAMQVLDTKEIFPFAYIKNGQSLAMEGTDG